MLAKILGCDQMCPFCKKQCDQAHEDDIKEDRIHRCQEGHQIGGFGGVRDKNYKKAITYGCHDLDDKDMVCWGGNDMRWDKFKALMYSERKWDLEEKD